MFNPHDPRVRALEVKPFQQLIARHDAIQDVFATSFEDGMPAIELNREAAHLFYHDGTRELLSKVDGVFTTKRGHRFTESELMAEIERQPERFSNNVVSRPLMQDFLFPTLAYIADQERLRIGSNCVRSSMNLIEDAPLIATYGSCLGRPKRREEIASRRCRHRIVSCCPLPDHLFDEEAFDESLYAYRALTEAVGQEAGRHGRRFVSRSKQALERIAEEMRAEAKREHANGTRDVSICRRDSCR